jgi:hypothetical protein
MQIGSILSWAIAGLGVLLVSCVAAPIRHDYELSPGQAFSETRSRAMLLPINEVEPVPDGLEVGEDQVFEQLKSYLESRGLSIETTNTYDYRLAANSATESVHNERLAAKANSISGEIEYSNIVPGLLANLGSEADLLIVANMVIRTGESSGGRTVRWDGVKRRISVPPRWRMTGTESVASIFVSVYHRDGKRVFSGYGGLDLLFAPNLREERYELIPDRLQNIQHLREGVCIALYPYFGKDETCH